MTTYTAETVKRIWDDETGEHIYIGPDGDGLDLVDIRSVADDGHEVSRITVTKEQSVLVAKAILELYGEE